MTAHALDGAAQKMRDAWAADFGLRSLLDVLPERHTHVKGNTAFVTRAPAGTADVLAKALELAVADVNEIARYEPGLQDLVSEQDYLTRAREIVLQ